jgi:hypothetical protein
VTRTDPTHPPSVSLCSEPTRSGSEIGQDARVGSPFIWGAVRSELFVEIKIGGDGAGDQPSAAAERSLSVFLTEGLKGSHAKTYSAGKRAVERTAKRTKLPIV